MNSSPIKTFNVHNKICRSYFHPNPKVQNIFVLCSSHPRLSIIKYKL